MRQRSALRQAGGAAGVLQEQQIVAIQLDRRESKLGTFGETLVVDWGLARDVTSPDDSGMDEPSTDLSGDETRTGHGMGTPGYMPPELTNSRKRRR